MMGAMIGSRSIMSYRDPRDGRDITIVKDRTGYWVRDEATGDKYSVEIVRGSK